MATPGWHPDPFHRHDHRWYDGTRWTDQISDAGVAGTDPYGTGPTPDAAPPPTGQTPGTPPSLAPPVSSRTTVWPIVAAAAVLVLGAAVAAFLAFAGADDTSGQLTAEVEGLQELLGNADPAEDDYELLGDPCIVDFEDLLVASGTEVPPAAIDDRAAAYNARGFDSLFYNCYLGVDPLGFSLDAVELDDDATVDDLVGFLEEESDDVEILDEQVHGGDVVLSCRDIEIPVDEETGDVENDPFCEYSWTYDGAGLAVIVAGNESLGIDGVAALDAIVPPLREALRDAAG